MAYKDPEKDKSVKKAWYIAHKAQQRARQKAQRAADPEKRRIYEKLHYQAHKEQISIIHKRYYAKNRDRLLAKARELDNAKRREQGIPPRYVCPPEERSERQKAAKRAHRSARQHAPRNDLTHAQWLEIQSAQNHRCAYCGRMARGHLTQDHITTSFVKPRRSGRGYKHVGSNESQQLLVCIGHKLLGILFLRFACSF